MNTSRQILELERRANVVLDRMTALNDQARASERALTPEEEAAWRRDEDEVKDLNRQLAALRGLEEQAAARARPIEQPWQALAMPERSGGKRFPGQAFTRYVGALALSKGNLPQAVEISQRWQHETPEVVQVLTAAARLGSTSDPFWLGRAAVAVGTTTDPTWASPLANYQAMASEFIDLLRPRTILGRLPGLAPTPFMVKVPRQSAGATAQWVGEGLSKPVSALAFDLVTIPFAKVAVICVITQELARFSTPSAEMLVRNDLIGSIAQFLDVQFIDPAVAPQPSLRPGSITNGVVAIPSTGSTVAAVTADLNAALLALMQALQGNITAPIWIMSPAAALFLATLRTAQDVFAFPGMSLGGTPGSLGPTPSLLGVPVVVSGNVAVDGSGKSNIILIDQAQILLADDGQVLIDTSTEASLQMDTAPATPPTPMISLFQQDMLAIKAERFIYWLRRRDGVVQVISGFPAATTP
jgi:HK97 family phage major capsid protein